MEEEEEEEVCDCVVGALLPHRQPKAVAEEGHLASGTVTL